LPVFSVRHRTIRAAVWVNDSVNGPFFTVTFSRSYQVDNEWREASSFGCDDLLVLAELIRQCFVWISSEMGKQGQMSRALGRTRQDEESEAG